MKRDWNRYIKHGKRCLKKHDPSGALDYFREAVEMIPVENRAELSRVLYYMGITLGKMGISSGAVRSWKTSMQLDKRGYASKMYRNASNGYGMVKQSTCEQDDWKAFYSVHICRYLETKKSRKLGSDAEKDMIWDLIYESWIQFKSQVNLKGKNPSEKLMLFKSMKIIFPFFMVPDDFYREPIAVDFVSKTPLSMEFTLSMQKRSALFSVLRAHGWG